MRAIASAANPHFRRWLELAESPRAVRAAGCTLAEGAHLAQAALAAQQGIEAVLLRRGTDQAQLQPWLSQLLAKAPGYELAAGLYDRLAPVVHGVGLLLVVRFASALDCESLTGDAVYLDAIQDPGNAGALVRVAAAAGVRTVLAGPGTASLWSPKALRAGQGAHFAVRIHENIAPERLKDMHRGPWIGAALDANADCLWQLELNAPALGWMFGAEGLGLGAAARAACTRFVRIPIEPHVESLNVVSAASVCLFERRRRSWSAGG